MADPNLRIFQINGFGPGVEHNWASIAELVKNGIGLLLVLGTPTRWDVGSKMESDPRLLD